MYLYLKGFVLSVFILLGCHQVVFAQAETGLASWYGPGLQANTTAGGELFDMNDLTAAHPSLPFNTRVKVTNLKNKKSVIVRINDRGPYIRKRVIDVSMEAARRLEIIDSGIAKVSVEVVKDEATEKERYKCFCNSIPIKSTEIPLAMLQTVHRVAFPVKKLNRDFSDIVLEEAAKSERPMHGTN